MAALGEMVVRIGADLSGLTSGLRQGEVAVQRTERVITTSGQRAERSLRELGASMRAMRASAAHREAELFAEQIKRLDPFQQQAAQSATAAAAGFGKLRGGLTSLAVASGALPGPLGRVASTLATLTLGSPLTVGVLAGIAAIGFAWRKLTEDSRKTEEGLKAALERLRELKRERELGPTGQTGADVKTARARLNDVADQFRTAFALSEGPAGRANPALKAESLRLAALYTDIALLVQEGERKVTDILTGEYAAWLEALRQAGEAFQRQRLQQSDDAMRALQANLINDPNAAQFFRSRPVGPDVPGLGDSLAKIGNDAIKLEIESVKNLNVSIEDVNASLREKVRLLREAGILSKDEMDRATATRDVLKGVGTGAIAGFAGAAGLGGTASGAIGAISAGAGPFGIIAAGFSGLVGDLLNVGKATAVFREQIRRLHASVQDFITSAELELGIIGEDEAGRRRRTAAFDEQRRALAPFEGFDINNPLHRAMAEQRLGKVEADRRIAEIERLNELEKELEKKYETHGTALDKATQKVNEFASALSNIPRVLNVALLRHMVTSQPAPNTEVTPPNTLPTDPPRHREPPVTKDDPAVAGAMALRAPSSIAYFGDIHITIPGSSDPEGTAAAVGRVVEKIASRGGKSRLTLAVAAV